MSVSTIERDLIASCISNPVSLDTALESLDPKYFSVKEYGDIWNLISGIAKDGQAISKELISIRAKSTLDKKSLAALDDVIANDPDGNVSELIRVIRERRYREKMKGACKELYQRAEKGNIRDVEHMIADMMSYNEVSATGRMKSIMSPGQVTEVVLEDLSEEIQGVRTPKLCSTGIPKIDSRESFFEGHRLVVVMAESGIGKTRFATQVAVSTNDLYNQADNDLGVLVFIHESGVKAWLKLLIARIGGIPTGYLKHGQWDALKKHGYEDAYKDALAKYESSRIYLTDSVSNISSLERNVDRFEALHNRRPGIIIIDYIQLLGGDPTLGEVRQLEDISWRLQRLADEHECQIFALSQLTKSQGGGVSPKWSRAIRENATMVLRIKDMPDRGVNARMIVNDKNRQNQLWSTPVNIDADMSTCTYKEMQQEANPWA